MSKHTAYEGQITFDCTFQSLESVIVSEAITAAVSEAKDFEPGSQQDIIFRNFRSFISNTRDIQFRLAKDADDDLTAFRDFWRDWKDSTDYAAMWRAFRKQTTLDIHNEWDRACDAAIPKRLLAPPDMRPDAPADEALDPNVLTPATA